jgi:hypothetical protein
MKLPSITKGAEICSQILPANASMLPRSSQLVLQHGEFVAPKRATMSASRTQALIQSATARSKVSPMGCPSVSSTSLKWSRST